MRVAIVDDEPAARRMLREYCERAGGLEIVGEYGDARSALEALRAALPDLVFLDIQLGDRSGLEVVRALDTQHLPLVVFVTAYDQYAVEAFEVSAVDYLLKPFDEPRFRRSLERVRERHVRAREGARGEQQQLLAELIERLAPRVDPAAVQGARLLAELGGRLHMLEAARIELVEADRNYVRLTVGRDTYHARSSLQQAEQFLQSQPMLRISRSCLINVQHLREVSRTPRGDFILVLAGGVTVTSSEGYREAVREYMEAMRLGGRPGDKPGG